MSLVCKYVRGESLIDVLGIVVAIDNGVNGMKVRDGDRRALAAATLEILHNPEKWWSSSVKVAERYS
ncbi:MAG: hypothetical protein QXW80_05630 [Candidatus Micrarchaeia archaeon]